MTRIAVLSDIHGFSLALETVLADLDQQGPFDETIVAGDLCELGPDPSGVIALLRERGLIAIHGNTDIDIVEGAEDGTDYDEVRYVIDQIGQDGVRYLASLPFSRRITPPGGTSPDDDLLIVHANPHDLFEKLDPERSDDELRSIIGETRAAAIAFGHIHICYIRQLDDTLLVDVSAVGNPKDGDLRCKYGILTWDESGRQWHAELRKLDYPLAETADQIRSSDLPSAEKVLKKLIKASY
jgi:predicted phosphodiesterase